MPFTSKAQQKACYATNGFGGKVDCKKWSDITNQKSLPIKVKESVAHHKQINQNEPTRITAKTNRRVQ